MRDFCLLLTPDNMPRSSLRTTAEALSGEGSSHGGSKSDSEHLEVTQGEQSALGEATTEDDHSRSTTAEAPQQKHGMHVPVAICLASVCMARQPYNVQNAQIP